MQRLDTLSPVRRLVGIAAAALMIAACGGSDDSSDSDTSEQVADDADAGSDGGDQLADNVARDAIAGDDGGELEDAIAGLSAETRYDIVAGQLDPEPSVEINGDDIRFVFPSGSVSEAALNCIIASVTQLETETVTLAYPDGEETC